MFFPRQDLIDIAHDDHDETKYKIVDEGKWIAEHKRECTEVIFEFEGKTYCLELSRSGSHFTDWYYTYEDWAEEVECTEVEPYEIIRIEWRAKK